MPPRRDPGSFMWSEAVELLDRAERLHRQFFRPAPPGSRRACWTPPVDVYETEDAVMIVVALPGVAADQLDIAVEDGVLVVAGERSLPLGRDGIIHRLEIPHGRFERRIELPAGAFRMGRRDLVAGCLVLALDKMG
ncbi:Hsp20/alpha crystallin family protein [Azospirillum canadense]|uniref:Hsp20/alpha crystallin family protein n=1 Tax=Azospirillum canadense TaxID=403962 RepID=UPI0022269E5C|nr:Hsp20/alpha crystallin family protein [Azospirillum canadense]MCW2243532.1 HSP20 family molecular chaperone IbpA [Azospirillum canadense]